MRSEDHLRPILREAQGIVDAASLPPQIDAHEGETGGGGGRAKSADRWNLLRLASSVAVRCVSMPSWELFDALTLAERDLVLPPSVSARLTVEAGAAQGWHRYVGAAGDVVTWSDSARPRQRRSCCANTVSASRQSAGARWR